MSHLIREYTVFEADNYVNLMPQLRKASLRPLSTADVMGESLEALNSKDFALISFWLDRYFDSPDGIAYHQNKRKVVYDAKPLINIEPSSQVSDGALIITPDEYKNFEGDEFSLEQLQKAGLDRRLGKDEILQHPIWLSLTRGDRHLLREYRDAVFAEIERRYGENTGMGVYLGSEQSQPSMRAWFVSVLTGRSNAGGNVLLISNARLVGVRSKVAEGDAQNLVREYTSEDVKNAKSGLKSLETLLEKIKI